MKPFFVYILRCVDGSYYTGHTDNLERRIGEHQHGTGDGYTASRRPVELAWSQECATREEALAGEMQIKGWGRKKKEAMMRGDWDEVSRLARSQSVRASTSSARTDLQGPATTPLPVRASTSSARTDSQGLATSALPVRASTSSARTDLQGLATSPLPVRASTGSARTDSQGPATTSLPVRPEPVEGREDKA